MTRVLISQSNYIPWRGFFAMLAHVDLLVLLDTVQFTRRDWRTRNRIRVNGSDKWLSIPVSGPRSQLINDVHVADSEWPDQHARKIRSAYAATLTPDTAAFLSDLYMDVALIPRLTHINERLLKRLAAALGIRTEFRRSEEFPDAEEPSRRLAQIAAACGATEYWSGPAARAYLDLAPFDSFGISVHYFQIDRIKSPKNSVPDALPYSIVHDVATIGINATSELCSYEG